MKKTIAAILLVVSAAAIAGCETMKGAGRDIEDGGQNLQNAAN
jgi:predicted small secreted protein